MKQRYTFHILPNAHLDPVWLWDWREGLNEGIITTRAVLDLMDEFPDLTFIRGESAVYQHIEQHDPRTFRRIQRMVEAGRWDIVGGTYVQPDTNLPSTETLIRHFVMGQSYFRDRFGLMPRTAWAADSFGHSAGLADILSTVGMKGYSFSRPFSKDLPISKAAFWWEGASGSRILAYRVPSCGWYGTERDEVPRRLDTVLNWASQSDVHNVGVYIGLGNHGGGPTRRHIRDVNAWASNHPEIKVEFSTLHRLFDALTEEARRSGSEHLPVHKSEMNFCLRGCYASMARLKSLYRKSESLFNRAERFDSMIAAKLRRKPADLRPACEAVLFNSFHDILPGSSIERAYDDQREWLGGAIHQSRGVELAALNALTARIDTQVDAVPADRPGPAVFTVFNPHPYEYRGPIELEAALDHRPIWDYKGRAAMLPVAVRGPDRRLLAHQVVATEHSSFADLPWRKRVVLPVTLPPLGWSVLEMQWDEDARIPKVLDPVRSHGTTIDNGLYQVSAKKGNTGVRVMYQGKPVFGWLGLHCVTIEDPWGSWGGMDEQPESLSLSDIRCSWKVTNVKTLEQGPERAVLWVRMEGGASRIDLSFALYRQREAVDVTARLFWNERAARLKMVLPVNADSAEFDVPGGTVCRGEVGEVPGGRWVRVRGGHFGFASDSLYNFDLRNGALRATIVRSTRYADDARMEADHEIWRPITDVGEHGFRFILTRGGNDLPRYADELEMPPVAIIASSHQGELGRTGSLFSLVSPGFKLLALKPAQDGRGWIVRLQETDGNARQPDVRWLDDRVALGGVDAFEIATWRFKHNAGKWRALRVLATEIAL